MRELAERFRQVRATTERLVAPLSPEDCLAQSMPDASPAKWHLAHTTWFFEAFVLARDGNHREFRPGYGFLFNSYYEAMGSRHPRGLRGLLSRPSLSEVLEYRAHVDGRILQWLKAGRGEDLVELGIHHEQQHQELILTDIKHMFGQNPLQPAYRSDPREPIATAPATERGLSSKGGVLAVGHEGPGFAFDNERPRHQVFVRPFEMATALVTNRAWKDFMADGGYTRAELWLSEGWQVAREQDWHAPLYWSRVGDTWVNFTLDGPRPVADAEPVCHVSYFEADAFARWRGRRLPTEAEWESVATTRAADGHFLESENLHPAPTPRPDAPVQLFGDVWQWTSSAYAPYPGYTPLPGAAGEYNGKFMCNQFVLRGGSCATPRTHIRATYRNFFPPHARWQFTGVRLAR
jgi:ergothioneine biosynthesis protein EgtB